MVARYAIGVGLGALVTFALFFLMQAIIATNEANLDEGVKGKLLDFVRLQDDQEIETKQRKPKPPPPPDEPPPRAQGLVGERSERRVRKDGSISFRGGV